MVGVGRGHLVGGHWKVIGRSLGGHLVVSGRSMLSQLRRVGGL